MTKMMCGFADPANPCPEVVLSAKLVWEEKWSVLHPYTFDKNADKTKIKTENCGTPEHLHKLG
jgi:hypothetical protein